MANALYPKTKAKLMRGVFDLQAVTIKLILINLAAYSYNAAHEFLADVPAGARVAVSGALTAPLVNAALARFDSNDVVLTGVTGAEIGALILFIDTGLEASSALLLFQDTGIVGVPFTPSGNDVNVVVDATGWFGL